MITNAQAQEKAQELHRRLNTLMELSQTDKEFAAYTKATDYSDALRRNTFDDPNYLDTLEYEARQYRDMIRVTVYRIHKEAAVEADEAFTDFINSFAESTDDSPYSQADYDTGRAWRDTPYAN